MKIKSALRKYSTCVILYIRISFYLLIHKKWATNVCMSSCARTDKKSIAVLSCEYGNPEKT